MKRYLIFILGLLFTTSAFSQIAIDKVEEDGSRIIITGAQNIYTRLVNAAAIRVCFIKTSEDDHLYSIRLTLNEGKMQFDKGRKLLLKFADDSIMELENTKEIGPADYEYSVTSAGTYYFTFPEYEVTEEDIEKIIEGQVVKIRVENNIGFFDRDIKKNKFSKALKKLYDAINAKKETKNDVYQNF